MFKVFNSIKAKLLTIIAIIVALFIVSYIMVYNSKCYSDDIVLKASQSKNLQLVPELIRNEFNLFLQQDVVNPDVYIKERSNILDSVENLVKTQVSLLDTLKWSSYLKNETSVAQIKSLKQDLLHFQKGNQALFHEFLDRGFQQSGKAGDWNRQGEYVENYIASLKNPTLLKSWINIRKYEFRYILDHNPKNIDALTDESLRLKAAVASSDQSLVKGIPQADCLRIPGEIDKYIETVLRVHNKDKQLGLGTNEGLIGNQLFLINTISAKSALLSEGIDSSVHSFINKQFILRVLLLTLFTLLVVFLITLSYRSILSTIRSIINYLHELLKGQLPEPLSLNTKDELGLVGLLLNEFTSSLRAKIKFAQKLGKGSDIFELKPLSTNDSLANALLDLQISLKKAAEEDTKYKIDEKKRAWSNEGLAKFGEILRFQTSDIRELSDLIIKNLVKYLNASQGGVFAYNDEDPYNTHLELVSAFAFDRKKYITKSVNIGEGLVGTCAQEKLTIYMTDIPEDYISITSGLGNSTPRSLLIVPLKTEENIYGILEIASFNILEHHEVEFVEKLAESIASTFASLKINVHTSQLLEQSKKQAEEMAQQEEEMRQNLEELQATQEESARKQAEIMSILSAIDSSSMVMELDMDGKITEVNSNYCSVLRCYHEDLLGKNIRAICYFNPQSEDYQNLWSELRSGRSITREEEVHFNNKTFFLTQNYSPIFDQDRIPYKVLVIAINKTEKITLEDNLSGLNQLINSKQMELSSISSVIDKALIFAELSPDGTILKANRNYLEVTGYLEKEVIHKNARFFLKPEELRQFDLIWGEVEKGKEHKGVVRRTKPTGEEYWLMSAAIPVLDERGHVRCIYFIAQDITEKKLKYQVLEEANKEIERLKTLYENNNLKD